MKTLLTALMIAFAFCSNAQTVKRKQTAQTIIEPRSIYLNGGTRAAFGGKSRTVIPIRLPEHTVSWYYSFSTSPGESGTQNLNLLAQLSEMVVDPTGLISGVANIKVPPGSASIDVYLLDEKNSDLFVRKVDNDGGTFYYVREGLVTNTRQAVVPISKTLQGTYYLGLKNPSSLDGVNITVEVVAVVEEVEDNSEQQNQAITLGSLGWKAFERGDYDRCLDLSRQALDLDNTLGFVHFNVALCYLIKGQGNDATTAYSKAIAITKKLPNAKDTFNGAIDDLNNYMDKFPSKADAQDILDLLTQEVKFY